jgi:predicted nucleic acid-binding protein
MICYCDSSFLIALYCHEDGLSGVADTEASKWTAPALLSPLSHLETTNGLCRKVFTGEITQQDCDGCIAAFERDIADRMFTLAYFNLAVTFRDARALSVQHSATGGYRSLDLLHIAAAKILGAVTFLSFDARLNALAIKEKLRVLK